MFAGTTGQFWPGSPFEFPLSMFAPNPPSSAWCCSPAAVLPRTRCDWWKWKVAPFTFDGVLVCPEPGHGRRANPHTDYPFAVW